MIDYISPSLIVSSLSAVFASVSTFIAVIAFNRTLKKEQFNIAFELNSRIEKSNYELTDIHNKLRKVDISEEEENTLLYQKRTKSIEYLNNCEFFAFLVNNKEIKNNTIKDYFRNHFEVSVRLILNEYYYDYYIKDKSFKEIKQLLKKWDINISPPSSES